MNEECLIFASEVEAQDAQLFHPDMVPVQLSTGQWALVGVPPPDKNSGSSTVQDLIL